MPPGGMWQIQRANIAIETGWTLDYIDSLSEFDVITLLGTWDGQAKAQG